jgi:ACS family hexuronate transporter-like MFS transporter
MMMLAGIPAVSASSSAMAVALISTATFAYCCWATNVLSLPPDLFPARVVASVLGISGTGAAAGSMLFMLAIGAVVERFSYTPVFVAAGVMAIGAAAVLVLTVHQTVITSSILVGGEA